MSSFRAVIIAKNDSDYNYRNQISLNLVNHIHNRTEEFRFLKNLYDHAASLNYLSYPEIDSEKNLHITRREYSAGYNSEKVLNRHNGYEKIIGESYVSPYKDILFSHKTFLNSQNKEEPLFFKHILPEGTVRAELQMVKLGDSIDLIEGVEVSIDEGMIFTNYKNQYNPNNGDYCIYIVNSLNSSNVYSKELLNPIPVILEATWEDIDLETGALKEGLRVFTKEKNTSGNNFYLNQSDIYYAKPLEDSLIKVIAPTGKSSEENWFVKITNGEFIETVNGKVCSYKVPEFYTQAFQPSFPYIYSPYNKATIIDKRLLLVNKKNIVIEPSSRLHCAIYIYDANENLIKIWTTDTVFHDSYYPKTTIKYDSTKISSWDSQSGMILLSENLENSWSIYTEYYYAAKELEYYKIDLNPLLNKTVIGKTVVIYIVPNVNDVDTAVHHLIVDNDGIIIECSQNAGISVENLQLKDSLGNYNPNTIIGMKYISDIETETFTGLYSTNGPNSKCYLVLAELNISDFSRENQYKEIPIREPGLNIKGIENFKRNPLLEKSIYGADSYGWKIAKSDSLVIECPITELEEYGGLYTKEILMQKLTKYLPYNIFPIIDYTYPYSELTINNYDQASINLEFTWIGNQYQYLLYKRNGIEEEWSLLWETNREDDSRDNFAYVDESVISGNIYYYKICVSKDGIVFPSKNSWIVEAK